MTHKRPDRVLGPNHDTFWDWCNKGELRLQCCNSCGKLMWPVVKACEHCSNDAFTWRQMSGLGQIASWCSFEHDYYQGLFPIPHDTILVELDEGPLFISNPVGLGYKDLALDMPVRVTFLDCEDSAGAFKLPVFEKR